MTIEFTEFPKIARLSRACTVTEKLDGTNSGIVIAPANGRIEPPFFCDVGGGFYVAAQSRNRFITPTDDNFGFARWVADHGPELIKLGVGVHFGEWWGAGVGRRYGLSEKRFSLFNTSRWSDPALRPECCHVVPVLYEGVFTYAAVMESLELLEEKGSMAAPGFMKPEGVVVWHDAARIYFKKTLDKDDEWKGKNRPASGAA